MPGNSISPFPGVQIKRLFKDPATGMITTLLKAAAGAIYPAHQHGGLEQIYVIDGATVRNSLISDGCTIEAGTTIENSVIGVRCRIGEARGISRFRLIKQSSGRRGPLHRRYRRARRRS